MGTWLTQGKEPAKIEIYKLGTNYSAKIIWLKFPNDEDGKPKVDKNNFDKSKRQRTIIGMNIMSSFSFNQTDKWVNGKLYDPESGDSFDGYITLTDKNTLK